MATYYSSRTSSDDSHSIKSDLGVNVDLCEFSPATALSGSDIIELFTLPKGAKVLGFCIGATGIQSGTDSVFTLGDADDTDRFFTTADGLYLRSNASDSYWIMGHGPSGFGYEYTADTDVIMTITTAGTGMTTGGTIKVGVMYFIDGV